MSGAFRPGVLAPFPPNTKDDDAATTSTDTRRGVRGGASSAGASSASSRGCSSSSASSADSAFFVEPPHEDDVVPPAVDVLGAADLHSELFLPTEKDAARREQSSSSSASSASSSHDKALDEERPGTASEGDCSEHGINDSRGSGGDQTTSSSTPHNDSRDATQVHSEFPPLLRLPQEDHPHISPRP